MCKKKPTVIKSNKARKKNRKKSEEVLLVEKDGKGEVRARPISKGFPHRMGDHSPSISTLNKCKDVRGVFVKDRKTIDSEKTAKEIIAGKEISTHHATSAHKALYTEKDILSGKRHHTVLTSLREKGCVGEQEIFDDFDELLDKTLFAYHLGTPKVYSDTKDPFRSYVRKANPEENIKQENHGNVFRHSVDPFVAQSFINIDLRAKADGKTNPLLTKNHKKPPSVGALLS
jgi:hypothetical protein